MKSEETLANLVDLANFWEDVNNQDEDRFSTEVLKKLFVLNYAPNGMWTYFISVYYLQNRKEDKKLDEELFIEFLNKTIAYIWAYAMYMPGVNALRTPIYAEMVNIVNNKKVEFNDRKFDIPQLRTIIENYEFYNRRPITKSMLAWWAFEDEEQELIELDKVFDIEHIYARNRYEKEKSLSDYKLVDKLGNKSLLEKRINIRASDYRFSDKKKYYVGFKTATGKDKLGTDIKTLRDLASNDDFVETDVITRNDTIINAFIKYVVDNNLSK